MLALVAEEDSGGPGLLLGLGVLLLVAGLFARLGQRLGLPTIPFFMGTGILLGPTTFGPTVVSEPADLELVAAIGLVLLLFHLGVEFPLEQVRASGRRLLVAAGTYIVLNVSGGLAFGLALGWGRSEALVLAGALGISSSAIVTKLVVELRRLANAETPLLLGIIVVEDLFLAFYLALLSPVLSGSEGNARIALDIALAFVFLLALLVLARYGGRAVAALIDSDDDELLTLGFVGLALLVAGASAELGVSDAIGALMIGLVVSRTRLRARVERLVAPLRDTFAAVFFLAFGLSIDVGALGGVAAPALLAVLLTLALNVTAGLITARLYRLNQRAAANIGLSVLGRGEFSLILAALGLAAGLDARLGAFVALYVLVLAVISPLLASRSELLARLVPDRLLVSNWQYVRQETMTMSCTHLDSIRITDTDAPMVCPRCQATGDAWVHLRMCLSCGNVGCCDDSRNQHATHHHLESGHPLVAFIEPGDDWQWCYIDQTLVVQGLGSR